MFLTAFSGLLLLIPGALSRDRSTLQRSLIPEHNLITRDSNSNSTTYSHTVAKCPGYKLGSLLQSSTGLTAKLTLAGNACNAFGRDIKDLTIEVTYEQTRLHVNIYDTAKNQFVVPEDVVARPSPPSSSFSEKSDLVFNYNPAPFEFWITRRDDPKGAPIFDTRVSSLPKTPIPPVISTDNSTALDAFPLVFEDQYLQLTSALPLGANIYGLGEVLASSGFRRDVGTNGGHGTVQTLWARDVGDPIDENVYGSHPIYLEHRYDAASKTSKSHGVLLMSAAGADVLLMTPSGAKQSLVEYRTIGGVLDFWFFSGPTPQSVIEQYGNFIGLPTLQPYWGFGFHLCRWGYHNISDVKQQVQKMREANIPLEVMWNDIDLYHAFRDFTNDPVSFPTDEVRAFIGELTKNHQHYVPILDAAIPVLINSTDVYDPYSDGIQKKVFMTKPDGTNYVGQVWPGYTVFPDWFAQNTQQWWTDSLRNWSKSGVEYSGIWLDMNEVSSFCDGSCGDGADLSKTDTPFILPGRPGNLVTDYPECYNSTLHGTSGNVTVDGKLTCDVTQLPHFKRGLGAAGLKDIDINAPPYAIHNGNGRLSIHATATNATHANGVAELDVHNLWGMMEEKATHKALLEIYPGKRPFIIARSTFPSSGKWSGHWLGDNTSKWQWMYLSIQGVLQFQLFQVPFVGADTCGFNGNTDEELCNRWMQLSAFHPFYRNHNVLGALSQEPYRWDSVAEASRVAIAARYALLPYWYTLFYQSSTIGTAPVRALFFEFPNEPELFAIDRQFLVGRDILVTPVLAPNATTVDGIFPGHGSVTWRDWYTHNKVNAKSGVPTTLAAPLGHINVHIRDGAALLLHAKPAYTVEETRQGPYELLVSLAADGSAAGTAYIDDGESVSPPSSRSLTFVASHGHVSISGTGAYKVQPKLDQITILGVTKPGQITVQGKGVTGWKYAEAQQKIVVSGLGLDLGDSLDIKWN